MTTMPAVYDRLAFLFSPSLLAHFVPRAKGVSEIKFN